MPKLLAILIASSLLLLSATATNRGLPRTPRALTPQLPDEVQIGNCSGSLVSTVIPRLPLANLEVSSDRIIIKSALLTATFQIGDVKATQNNVWTARVSRTSIYSNIGQVNVSTPDIKPFAITIKLVKPKKMVSIKSAIFSFSPNSAAPKTPGSSTPRGPNRRGGG